MSGTYFDSLYADRNDPWDLSSSRYERRKRELLLASLPRLRYRSGFEPGCALGVTTAELARRCDRLLAMDCAAAAVEQARVRVQPAAPHVMVAQGLVPGDWPEGSFDLVVLSELLYYLGQPDRRDVAARTIASLAPGGDIAAVHWRHAFAEAASTGDEVHAELVERLSAAGLSVRVDYVEDDFRLLLMSAGTGSTASPGRIVSSTRSPREPDSGAGPVHNAEMET